MAQGLFSPGGESIKWSELKASVERGEVEEVVFEGERVRARVASESEPVWVTTYGCLRTKALLPLNLKRSSIARVLCRMPRRYADPVPVSLISHGAVVL